MTNHVDIRITAHPSRMENVSKMLYALQMDESIVVWDDRETGGDGMYTARKAWTAPLPEGCTHRLVMPDDLTLCNHFVQIVNAVAASNPRAVVSISHGSAHPAVWRRYAPSPRIWGWGIMIPADMVGACWRFIERFPDDFHGEVKRQPEITKHDTAMVWWWAAYHRIPIVDTVPSLTQHIGDKSLIGITERRVSPDFTMEPPLDGW